MHIAWLHTVSYHSHHTNETSIRKAEYSITIFYKQNFAPFTENGEKREKIPMQEDYKYREKVEGKSFISNEEAPKVTVLKKAKCYSLTEAFVMCTYFLCTIYECLEFIPHSLLLHFHPILGYRQQYPLNWDSSSIGSVVQYNESFLLRMSLDKQTTTLPTGERAQKRGWKSHSETEITRVME